MRNLGTLVLAALLSLILISCGGGGGSGTSSSSTSSPQGAVAGGSADSPTNLPANSEVFTTADQLSDSVDISSYASVGLVSSNATLSAWVKFQRFIDGWFISPSYAVDSGCSASPKQLVGVTTSGDKKSINPISSKSKAGFCDLVDVGRYFLTTTSSVYKNGKVCNLALLRKSDGKLFCSSDSVPVDYVLPSASGFNSPLQVTGNQNYAYLTINSSTSAANAQNLNSYTQSVKVIRLDFSGSSPAIDVIADYDSSGYTAILGLKALNNGNVVIGRMAPSSDPAALSDGLLRMVEHWTLTRSGGTLSKAVASVDYQFTPTGGSRNFNLNCFLDYTLNDDDALLAMYGSAGGYRSTLWRIPKPSSPTASVTPIRLSAEGGSRVCWGSYPMYAAGKIYSLWQNISPSDAVDIATTIYDGSTSSESVTTLYNTGNTVGGWSSIYGTNALAKDFFIIPQMVEGAGDKVVGLPINGSGLISPIVPLTIINSSANLKVVSISADASTNKFTVTADEIPSNGNRVVKSCSYSSISTTYTCRQISSEPKNSYYGAMRFFMANPN